MKKKTINIEPYGLRTTKLNSRGEFSIVVEDHNKTINIKLDFWWIQYIADKLHGVILVAQERVDGAKQAMKGGL